MTVVEVSHVNKTFGPIKAVDDVSFNVEEAEIFGLLGPNGAGKTTIIRLMLGIFEPQGGSVSILGGVMNEDKKNQIGYMPEERGLYQDVLLERVLVYLAMLKGLPRKEAHRRVALYLERFDLWTYRNKRVKELSKGMQQKAQIIATLVHQPRLVVVDEPFSGLDPVNTQMVKDLLLELRADGTTIIMSTHQMHQVEELCDRILLINRGRVVLYGDLDQIRRQFAGNAVLVQANVELPVLPGVDHIESVNGISRLVLSPEINQQQVLHALVELGIPLEKFEVAMPTLSEIFIRVVQDNWSG